MELLELPTSRDKSTSGSGSALQLSSRAGTKLASIAEADHELGISDRSIISGVLGDSAALLQETSLSVNTRELLDRQRRKSPDTSIT